MTPALDQALDQARARLLEDLRRAKDAGHNVQAWKIKATLAGFDMAVDIVRGTP